MPETYAMMGASRRGPGIALVILFWALVTVLWFGSLTARDLAGTDEGRYSEIAREMALTGDYVTPRLDGLKYFEKPALQYWLTALSFKAFGQSEFVARLWPGLFGFLTVLLVGFTARRLWGGEVGRYAALTTVSMVWMQGVSHVITVDMAVSFFLTVALCGFLLAQDDRTPESERRPWMLLVWAAMAAATLSKGLIGIVIPGAALVFYSLCYRDFKPWTRMQWIWGPVVLLALGAPWFVLASLHNAEFAHFFFIHEHFERFATNEAHRPGGWYYFIPILVGGLLPWTTLLPSLTRYAAAPEAGARFQANRLLLVWCVFIFVFFSLSGSKLPGYILPMFPALGLLLGRMLARAPDNILRRHAWIIAALFTAGAVYAPFFGRTGSERTPVEYNHAASQWVLVAALSVVLLSIIAARMATRSRKQASVMWLSLAGAVFAALAMFGYQVYSPVVSAKNAALAMQPYLRPDVPVFSVSQYDQTLPFYLKRTVTLVNYVDEFHLGETVEPNLWIPTLNEFARHWRAAPEALALTGQDTYEQLAKMGLTMTIIYRDPRRIVIKKP
ncbi:MAG: phospholipid carrier-dependent glycosyltransferase [Stenotrophobium sp.]